MIKNETKMSYENQFKTTALTAPKRTFPLTIGLRTYFSEEEFQKALNDFLAWKAHKQSKRARRKGG